MKKILLIGLALSGLPLLSWAQQYRATETGLTTDKLNLVKNVYYGTRVVQESADPVELLGCPEGTVLGGEYDGTGYSGYQASDSGRKGMSTVYYQYYNGCYNTINGIRFLGTFRYWTGQDWVFCTERGGIDENGEMTEPIRFEIGFHKVGSDGMPGETIYKKQMDILGSSTHVITGYEGNQGHIYEFSADLGEELKLYEGYISVTATKVGDEYSSCWFGPFTASSVPGFGLLLIDYEDGNGANFEGAMNPMCYCLKGDGSFAAQKSLSISRIISPSSTSSERHQKVQVELENVGEQDMSGVKLELWVDGQLVVTEESDVTIKSLATYKYTFKQRIDLSDGKGHVVEVRNVTSGDEKFGTSVYTVETSGTSGDGEYCEAGSVYYDDYISSVKIGDINNQSEGSEYSDFTDMKTSIRKGEKLTLELQFGGEPYYYAVWVDWNGDKVFDDYDDVVCAKDVADVNTVEISIPEGIEVKPGETRMRILATSGSITACGGIYFGEYEDYTLVIEHNDNSPVMSVDKNDIEVSLKDGESANESFKIQNGGSVSLDAKVEVEYSLPYSPDVNPVVTRTAERRSEVIMKCAPARAKVAAPTADEQTQYVLKYDRGVLSNISLSSGDFATYATYYPGEMLANISGMKISSVDVYLKDIPTKKASIVIYGEGTTDTCGDLIVEKVFTPVRDSWNTVVLDEPVTIGEQDLWIGVYMEGFVVGEYQMGVDRGPATLGFGDLVNVGGDIWWSLNDLGIEGNYCIRANVIGERTPAINWLSVSENNLSVAGASEEEINVGIKATNLENTIYEALIKIQGNDELLKEVRIPVYLLSGDYSGLEVNSMPNARILVDGDMLSVIGSKEVQRVTVFDMNGRLLSSVASNNMNVSALSDGIYLVFVTYKDGSNEIAKTVIE